MNLFSIIFVSIIYNIHILISMKTFSNINFTWCAMADVKNIDVVTGRVAFEDIGIEVS